MSDAVAKHRERMLDGAARYAAGDKSDPFAYGRALAHIVQGICDARCEPSKEYVRELGETCYYDAKETVEKRVTADGKEFFATVYHNMVRP